MFMKYPMAFFAKKSDKPIEESETEESAEEEAIATPKKRIVKKALASDKPV